MLIAQTERLIIRHFCDEDISPLAQMLADPEVMRYSVNGVMTLAATQKFVDGCRGLYAEKGYGSWALQDRQTSAFIGFAGLTPEVREGYKVVEVGYRLARTFWKQGLATEAAAKVLEYGFQTLALPSISCTVVPEHIDSINVAEKIGFSSYTMSTTHGQEVRIYTLTIAEWQAM